MARVAEKVAEEKKAALGPSCQPTVERSSLMTGVDLDLNRTGAPGRVRGRLQECPPSRLDLMMIRSSHQLLAAALKIQRDILTLLAVFLEVKTTQVALVWMAPQLQAMLLAAPPSTAGHALEGKITGLTQS